jgi:hypothetical protein
VVIDLEQHVPPMLGRRPLASIERADIEALCATLPLAPSTTRILRRTCPNSSVLPLRMG